MTTAISPTPSTWCMTPCARSWSSAPTPRRSQLSTSAGWRKPAVNALATWPAHPLQHAGRGALPQTETGGRRYSDLYVTARAAVDTLTNALDAAHQRVEQMEARLALPPEPPRGTTVRIIGGRHARGRFTRRAGRLRDW